MRITRILFAACLCAFAAGCVSGAIDRHSSKYRNLFVAGSTRDMFRDKLGVPIESWESGSTNLPQHAVTNSFAYDAFAVRGKIAKPGDGSAQATLSAISAGTAESIMIPVTILSVAAKAKQRHTLVVYFDATLHYKRHELYDEKGRREDSLGY